MNEQLIPEGLRDVFKKVYTSADQVEDARVKLALFAVLNAIRSESAAAGMRSNVVEFVPSRPSQDPVGSATSR